MIDYSLKFVDAAAAMTVLMDGENLRYPATDIIGTIWRNTGTEELPVVEDTPGFHVNVRTTEEVPELEEYRVFPVTPVRVWA